MKKLLITVIILLLVSIILILVSNIFWKWNYVKSAWDTILLNLVWDTLTIWTNFWLYNSSLKISYIDNEFNLDKNEIYISIFSKFYKLSSPIYNLNNKIKFNKIWTYKVFYKNPNWNLDFIKNIEYK